MKSGLIRRFGEETAMGTYLSTHAIAVFPQSHRLKPNLTRLVSAAHAARCVFKLVCGLPQNFTEACFARFDIIREKGFASVAVGFVKNKGFGISFPNPLFFYFGAKGAKLLLL